MKLSTRKIDRRPSKELFYLIESGGVPVGFLQKVSPTTRTEEHPWKLFLYDGEFVPGETSATMITVSYGKSFGESKRELLRIAGEKLEARSAV